MAAGVGVLAALFAYTYATITREQARLSARFPTPSDNPVTDTQD